MFHRRKLAKRLEQLRASPAKLNIVDRVELRALVAEMATCSEIDGCIDIARLPGQALIDLLADDPVMARNFAGVAIAADQRADGLRSLIAVLELGAAHARLAIAARPDGAHILERAHAAYCGPALRLSADGSRLEGLLTTKEPNHGQ